MDYIITGRVIQSMMLVVLYGATSSSYQIR
jgi:hypothetical protein